MSGGRSKLLVRWQCERRELVSINPAAVRVNWRRAAPDRWSTNRIFATRHTLLLGMASGEVLAYCRYDGSLGWSHKLSSAPIRSIGESDTVPYVGTPQGTLYAITAPTSCS